ncbi:MAG TPA: type II toxin-antitoxin system HicB family antitoxin [Negativicutes bacterium]|nr:type II toxin-antitoxin system HicB family antitoxin [Negativicutes bacterium]
MKKVTYIAVFEPAPSGGFGVYFPDLPGCTSMGDDFEEATRMAEEALGLHLWGMEKDNEEIFSPTQPPFEGVPSGAIIAAVTVFPDLVKNEMDNRAMKTNVTIPAWLKEMAEREKINFSQVLQTALKERLRV